VALPEIRRPARAKDRTGPGKLTALIVLADRKFVIFLIAAAMILASHSAFYGFATLHWRSLGHSETMIGLFWAEGTIAEILVFMFAHRLIKHVGALGLMFLGAVAGVIRWTIMAYATSVTDIAAIQLLHGFTFGASHLGAMYYINSHVADHLSATAQGLYSSTVMGLALSGATLVSGYLFDAHGGLVFLAMAGMSMVGLLVLVLLSLVQGK
jgi:PPP family 3-phenylpropionic acid transporter